MWLTCPVPVKYITSPFTWQLPHGQCQKAAGCFWLWSFEQYKTFHQYLFACFHSIVVEKPSCLHETESLPLVVFAGQFQFFPSYLTMRHILKLISISEMDHAKHGSRRCKKFEANNNSRINISDASNIYRCESCWCLVMRKQCGLKYSSRKLAMKKSLPIGISFFKERYRKAGVEKYITIADASQPHSWLLTTDLTDERSKLSQSRIRTTCPRHSLICMTLQIMIPSKDLNKNVATACNAPAVRRSSLLCP